MTQTRLRMSGGASMAAGASDGRNSTVLSDFRPGRRKRCALICPLRYNEEVNSWQEWSECESVSDEPYNEKKWLETHGGRRKVTKNQVELPQEIYEAVRRQAAAQEKSPDALVAEWVSAHLDAASADNGEGLAAFRQQIAAFERMKPALLEQYAGQYVALRQGEVVASGEDKLDVSRRVREQFGPGGYYVAFVAPDAPRTVRMLSPRVIGE